MKSSIVLEQLVPRLRRFAHACSASRETADHCVERAIEAFKDCYAGCSFETAQEIEHLVYRLVEQALEANSEGSFEIRSWRALILVVVEEFTPHEAARILGITDSEVTQRLKTGEATAKRVIGGL